MNMFWHEAGAKTIASSAFTAAPATEVSVALR
jgi:hypothetical protein